EKLAELAKPFYGSKDIGKIPAKTYHQAVSLELEKVKLLTDVPKLTDFLLWDEYEYREEAVNKVLKAEGAAGILDELAKRLKALEPFDVPASRICARRSPKIRA